MRDSDWSRQNLLRSDWLGPSVALITTLGKNLSLLVPYWYLNFAILSREYSAGFYFRDFSTQICKKGIKFRDLGVINFILLLFSNFQSNWKSNVRTLLYKLTIFHLLMIQNGAFQLNQLASSIVDAYLVYAVAITS